MYISFQKKNSSYTLAKYFPKSLSYPLLLLTMTNHIKRTTHLVVHDLEYINGFTIIKRWLPSEGELVRVRDGCHTLLHIEDKRLFGNRDVWHLFFLRVGVP